MPKYYRILDNGVENPMARDEGMSYEEAFGNAFASRKKRAKRARAGEGMGYNEAFGSAYRSGRKKNSGKKTGPSKPSASKPSTSKPSTSAPSGRVRPISKPASKVKGTAVAGKSQAMRRADKSDAAKRRISGTTRGGRSKY